MEKKIRMIIVVTISALLIIGYYFYLSTRSHDDALNKPTEETEVQKVIDTNLVDKYPSTPRGVVKFYNRILKCYYNEKITEEQLIALMHQQQKLMDEELLANNPDQQMIQNVRNDINDFKNNKRTIRNSSVCGSNEVVYKTIDGRDCAYVTCSYFMKVGSDYETTVQRYVLRRDEQGNWKILVYYIVKGD